MHDNIIRRGDGGPGVARESVLKGAQIRHDICRVGVEIQLIKYGVGGATVTVGPHVLINESIHGATLSEEYALDNIFHSELAVSILRAGSVYARTKHAKAGQVRFHACGLEIQRILILSMRQKYMNMKEYI
jgi:hypothetical protein